MALKKTILFKSTALCAPLFAGLAHAETIHNAGVDEIVIEGRVLYSDQVNALKTPMPILDVPQSLSIVTDLDIKRRGFTELGDIIRYTPGVNTSQGEGHRDSIVFRGNRSTADFYIDGVRDDVQYYRPLYNLEQVEILRGPNALLFGRGGTGGIVNRVTKKGVVGESFTGLDIGLDTFGAYDVAVDTNFTTSDTSALRINAFYSELENHRDLYEGTRLGINPTFKVELAPQTTLDLSYEYADHERFIDRGIPTFGGEPEEDLRLITFGTTDTNLSTLQAHIVRGMLSHELSDNVKGNVTLHYGDYEKVYTNLYASDYDRTAVGGPQVELDGYSDPTERTNFVASGNLVSQFATGTIRHTLLAGLEFIDTSSDNLRFDAQWSSRIDAGASPTSADQEWFLLSRPINISQNADGNATFFNFDQDLNRRTSADINVQSLFVQDQIDLTDQFKLLIGARFDRFDIEVVDSDDGLVTPETASRTDEEVSPRLGLIYKPMENVSLYGSYSESFLPRSGEQFKNLSGGADRLDPDVFENAEVGVKWDFAADLSFTAAYFQSEQTRAVRDDITGESSEIQGLEVDGFELQLQGHLTDQFFLTAGYSYLDGETGSGDQPRELPENMLSIWGAYEVNEQLGFGLGFTHQSESKITNSATSPILPSYTRVDASAYYNVSDDLTLRLNLENLTNEVYFPHSHSTHQATVGEPLNARISLSARF